MRSAESPAAEEEQQTGSEVNLIIMTLPVSQLCLSHSQDTENNPALHEVQLEIWDVFPQETLGVPEAVHKENGCISTRGP